MKTVKKYGWALKIVGAALLLGLALVLEFGEGESIVVPFIGASIIIYSVIRLVPYVRTQKNDLIKTINIIEITVDVMIGIALIVVTLMYDEGLGSLFGYLLGTYLLLRGAVHFYGVSEGKERSDLPLYIFHVGALVLGSYVMFHGNFTPALLIHIILGFSVVVGGFLVYDGGKGYKVYRYEKSLYQQDISGATESVAKEVPIMEEETEEVTIVS